ncbi:hypothetical protein LOTGIDRAFT_153951 [Lottia gigantea]|uniref:Complex I assembly factor TIMMDC1, mitochondrial n=1 Tax=Lottia gigantea TaxID=225164 RepID=V4BRJ6_LOTGI|nr:hypothetical protein LOTGIDRAFT_153951 [Lottia gigantea]ESO91509.1 hypothetical protein LOTGIDRAFT_153951 [Lottia gigantea]
MTTNNDEEKVEKYSHFRTILCKKFLLGLKLTNIFHFPKVKAQEPNSDTTVTNSKNNDKEVNDYSASAPSSSSINTGEIKSHPSRTNVINGVDISQFISENEVQKYLQNESGRDRLLEMFSRNHLNEYSSQVRFIARVVGEVAVLSCIIFSYKFGQGVSEDFKRNNRGTLYSSRYLAKRRFNDHLILSSMKNGLHWSFKISSFTAMYLLLSQSISTYKNKTSPLEYGIAGEDSNTGNRRQTSQMKVSSDSQGQ